MTVMTNFKGIIPAIAVPFRKDHSIDEAELARFATWLAKRKGIVGLMTNGHTGEVNSLSFSPDGKTLVSISDNSALDLWDAQTWTLRHSLPGMVDGYGQPCDEVVAFSADSSTIAQAQ